MNRWPFAWAIVLTTCLVTSPAPIGAGECLLAAAQPADDRPLSLDDLDTLDALLAADTESAHAFDRRMVTDLVAMTLVFAFGLVSFFRKSEPLKLVSLVLAVAYLGFYKATLVSIVDIFGALQLSLPTFATRCPTTS